MERQLSGRNFLKIGCIKRGWPFSSLQILENAVPFAAGSCRKFKLEVLVEWKTPDETQ